MNSVGSSDGIMRRDVHDDAENKKTEQSNIFVESLRTLTPADVAPNASAKRKKRSAVSLLRTVLIAICGVIFAVCVVELADIFMNYKRADDLYNNISDAFNSSGRGGSAIMAGVMPFQLSESPLLSYSQQKSSSVNGGGSHGSVTQTKSVEFQRKLAYLEQLRDENPDTYGYILIEGTSISYPVVQTRDNNYYLKRGFNGSKLNSGTIFVDFRNAKSVSGNRNIVIYGHNMLNGSMFHDVARYDLDFPSKYGVRYDGSEYGQNFFDTHRYIKLFTFDGIYTFEVFSFYETDENDKYFMTNFASDEAFLDFCNRAISRSQYDTGITMTADDIMITLSTCVNLSPTGRYACHARLIKIEN